MIYNQCLILVKKIVTTPVVDVILILKTILRKKAIYLFIYYFEMGLTMSF